MKRNHKKALHRIGLIIIIALVGMNLSHRLANRSFNSQQLLQTTMSSPKRVPAKTQKTVPNLGPGIDYKTDSKGRLTSIEGNLYEAATVPGFDPTNEEIVKNRVLEILYEIRDDIGAASMEDFKDLSVLTGEFSAQAEVRQSIRQYPVKPGAGVTVRLGREGQVAGVDIRWYSKVDITNDWKMDETAASGKAKTVAFDPAFVPQGRANRVVWIDRVPAGEKKAAQGRLAYEFSASGRQIIIDGQDGNVLMNRNRKVH